MADLQLQRVAAAVIGCYARPEALDTLDEPTVTETLAIRVARDELLLLAGPDDASECLAAAEQMLAADANALALDLSGGFAIWRVRGDFTEVFARLCAAPSPQPPGPDPGMPPATIQALFAHVPAKLVMTAEELLVVVSSAVSHHVRDRIVNACSELGPRELEPTALSLRTAEAEAA